METARLRGLSIYFHTFAFHPFTFAFIHVSHNETHAILHTQKGTHTDTFGCVLDHSSLPPSLSAVSPLYSLCQSLRHRAHSLIKSIAGATPCHLPPVTLLSIHSLELNPTHASTGGLEADHLETLIST